MEQQQQFLQEFYDVSSGVSKYITLDLLEIGVPYEISQFRFYDKTFGHSLVVDLAVGFWLFLPKRIGNLATTEEQLKWLNSQNYWMIFKGRNEKYRNMALIEFKTLEQFLLDQATAAIELPTANLDLGNIFSAPMVKDTAVQTEEVLPSIQPLQQDTNQNASKENVSPKNGAAPKVTIKVKRERR